MRSFLAEVIGTFCLVFAGTGAIVINDVVPGSVTHVGIALTFGLIVMAMIYSLGDISGAHLNPAVTVAFWAAKQFDRKKIVPYVIAQLIGAILASCLLRVLFLEHDHLGATLPRGPWWQSFVLEFVLTFLLMFVVLNVATGSKETGIMAGAAIGGTVALEAMFAGPICGASMNPARSIAPALVSGQLQHLWIYIVATTAGALFAVVAYQLIHVERQRAVLAADQAIEEESP
ncbi:MIP family channel protein [Bremerella cremea]|uniref:MIP/aquaporin family protein n=1 Tax=Bremerella cremea TaxID=1031537 RepID=UPI0031EA8BAE